MLPNLVIPSDLMKPKIFVKVVYLMKCIRLSFDKSYNNNNKKSTTTQAKQSRKI